MGFARIRLIYVVALKFSMAISCSRSKASIYGERLFPQKQSLAVPAPGTDCSETWESSVLLLFETLPWLGPSAAFFPVSKGTPGEFACF